jgi:hypothetical protein
MMRRRCCGGEQVVVGRDAQAEESGEWHRRASHLNASDAKTSTGHRKGFEKLF